MAMYDPTRVPNFRWERAKQLATGRKWPSRTGDDQKIHEAWRYLRRYQKCDPLGYTQLKAEYPHLWSAHHMSDEAFGAKWFIEAAVMANRTAEQIGEYVGCDPRVVQVYEDLFFDARRNLRAPGWVLGYVTGPAVIRKLAGRDYDFMYKTIAYELGWDAFEAFVSMKPMSRDNMTLFFNSLHGRLLKTGLVSMYGNERGVAKLLEQIVALRKIELEQGTEAAHDALMNGMGRVLDTMSITLIPKSIELTAEEPRALELMRSAQVPLPSGQK